MFGTVLSLYLDKRRGVQENTSMRSREFRRAQPEGTPKTECWYFLVHYSIFKSDKALAISIAISRAIAIPKPRVKHIFLGMVEYS